MTRYKLEVFDSSNNTTGFFTSLREIAAVLVEVWARHQIPHCIIAESPGVWFCKKCGAVIRVRREGKWMLKEITKREHERILTCMRKEVAHEAA